MHVFAAGIDQRLDHAALNGDHVGVYSLVPSKAQAEAMDHLGRGDLFMARKLYEDAVIEYRKAIAADRLAQMSRRPTTALQPQ